MPSSTASTTPTPMLSANELLEAGRRESTLSELEAIGKECFRPYAEAIKDGTHEKNYVIRLPGIQGFTDVFSKLNSEGLTIGVNSLDGKYHIFQHCHYAAVYQTEKIEMPQEKSISTSLEVRELFAPAMEKGEQLKIRAGSAGTVWHNDSDVGKSQDRLSVELYESIRDVVTRDTGDRIDIPLANSGNPKRPEIEVVAVNGKGEERTLLRQEKGLGISVNEVADLAQQRSAETLQPGNEVIAAESENEPAVENEASVQTQSSDELGTRSLLADAEAYIGLQDETIRLQDELISTQDRTIETQSETIASQGRTVELQNGTIETQDKTIETQGSANTILSSVLEDTNQANSDRNPAVEASQTNEVKPLSEPAPAPNAVETFRKSVEKLPQSQTKALWQKVSAEVSALGEQLQSISQAGKELGGTVAGVPKAIQEDTEALIQRGKQKLENIGKNIETRVKQTSLSDLTSFAIKGTGLAVEAGSKGLGVASRYLKDRADNIKSYGMAKAAIAIYNKGNARTGESIFKSEGYTVEAVTDGYTVKDSKDRQVMSFATNSKGQPISVTKSPSIQPSDYQVINRVSKSQVIHGSAEGETVYSDRLRAIAKDIREIIPEGESINGNSFHVSRQGFKEITISTQGFPRRELTISDGGEKLTSSLTIEDMNKLERNVEQSPKQATKEPEKVEMQA